MTSNKRIWRRVGVVLLLSSTWLAVAWGAMAAGPALQPPSPGSPCVAPAGAHGCHASIQAAVNAAAAGDTIRVAGGVYSESVYVDKVVTVVGGWQPAGQSVTVTVIAAGGSSCALDLNGGGGAYRNLTLTGAAGAGICGLMVGNLTLEDITARDNEADGLSLLVGGPLTMTRVVASGNGRDGLSYLCLGSVGTVVRILDGQWRENGRHGVSGGFSCENDVQRNAVTGNGQSGLEGFGGPCPLSTGRQVTYSTLVRNDISGNQVGLDRVCGGTLILRRNRIGGNVTGTRSVGQGTIRSENNFFVANEDTAWLIEGEANVESVNDTLVDHGNAAYALRPDPADCGRRPTLELVNGIVWETPAAFSAVSTAECAADPPYQIAVSYTLLVSPAAYAGDPHVTLGAGVGEEAPGFIGDGTWRLGAGAAAVDAGWNEAGPAEDYEGRFRPEDGDLDGTAVVDLGAYEYAPARVFLPLVAVP